MSVTDLSRKRDTANYDRIEISCAEEGKCMCMQAADAHPNPPWVVTKARYDLSVEWAHQAHCRDPDNLSIYGTSFPKGTAKEKVRSCGSFLGLNPIA